MTATNWLPPIPGSYRAAIDAVQFLAGDFYAANALWVNAWGRQTILASGSGTRDHRVGKVPLPATPNLPISVAPRASLVWASR